MMETTEMLMKVDDKTKALLDTKTPLVLAAIDLDAAICTYAFDQGPAQRYAVELAYQKVEDRIADVWAKFKVVLP